MATINPLEPNHSHSLHTIQNTTTNNRRKQKVVAKLFIDGDDIGLVIDISSGDVYGPGRNPVYDTTIDILCEKLQLQRTKPKLESVLGNILGPYKKIKKDDTLIKNKECCSICLDRYQVNEFKRTLGCSHTFHKKCVDKWLKKNTENNGIIDESFKMRCPICRGGII